MFFLDKYIVSSTQPWKMQPKECISTQLLSLFAQSEYTGGLNLEARITLQT